MGNAGRFRRLCRSLARVARTRYPAFLFGAGVAPGEVPVFTYHEVEAAALDEDLDYLERNGYRAIGLDELHERASARRRSRERLVVLTFDDARRNFWEVAFPVLRRRAVRAALFVPTYWIGGRGAERPGSSPPGFMSFEQLRECARSGLVDVESHSHRHALVSTSARLAGFATPETLARHDLFDWPMRREGGADVCGRPPLGTPIYESAPLLSAPVRVLEPEAAASACRARVADGGGEAFFRRPSALAELEAAHRAAVSRSRRTEERSTRAEVETELALAVETFRRGLGRRPRYFAYPWMLGSPESLSRLAGHGFSAAFGVALDFRRARRADAPLPVYARYKSDWLRFLPGDGRRRLSEVVPRKMSTFVKSQHLAH